ncbi:MAG: S16 family serine protease [Candidatus Woesearchaeota archaeon]
MKKWLMLALFAVLLSCAALPVQAKSGSVKLLAVSETPDGGIRGSMATLDLRIERGTGRVFIDTQPASKLDTQITTRFARDMACRYLTADCSRFDFFYTIKADSTIIGGPSAGAATAVLTISLLKDKELDEGTVITGTINSGYLIGSVGGIKEKISAAAENNMGEVLIPVTEAGKDEENMSIDYTEYGKDVGVEVVRVGTLDEALYEFTGERFRDNGKNVTISPAYSRTMEKLAGQLCNRSSMLSKEIKNLREDADNNSGILNDTNGTSRDMKERADNLTVSADEAYSKGRYYSAASYCFGANVDYHHLVLTLKNSSSYNLARIIEDTEMEIRSFSRTLENHEISTMTDLQAYMVSKERLNDAVDHLNKSISAFGEGNMGTANRELAYAMERVYSARSWSAFLGKEGKKLELSEKELKESCVNKINEAEGYLRYIQMIFPGLMNDVREDIRKAESSYEEGDYAVCLHKASLAKAEISIVLSTIGYKEDAIHGLLDLKLEAAKDIMVEQQENGIFPIVGYSYYEYAKSLRNSSIYSALLYSEYSLELSNLDIYFEAERIDLPRKRSETFYNILYFLAGAIAGALAVRSFYRKGEKGSSDKSRKGFPGFRPREPRHKRIKFDFRKK